MLLQFRLEGVIWTTSITITASQFPIPPPTKQVFRISILSEDEIEINKIIDGIKLAIPAAAIKDSREAKP